MIFRCSWGAGVCWAAMLLGTPGSARAEPLRFHLQGGAARALGGALERETSLGYGAAAAVELGLSSAVGLQAELGTVTLGGGDPPRDPTLAPRGTSSGQLFMVGLRARPFVRPYLGHLFSSSGLWLDANLGAVRTGDLTRLGWEAHLGYDLTWQKVAAGPFVGFLHIVQPDDTLRPDDAHIFTVGIHAMIGEGAPPPEPDRDGDGIIDKLDRCPDQPEDKDGFEDQDGCPDPDNDGDSVKDYEDACPNMAGKRTANPKTNGCPVGDQDHDGVLDDVDQCPSDPEDKDGFRDEDGCPDPDNDRDGILDTVDKCPNEPETINGYADDDGCPDEAQVRVIGDKIILDDRVHFETNRSVVLMVSQPLLWRVAQLIIKHPEYQSVEVQGYADERGEESYNQKLSEARAKAVRDMLVRYGVSRERLTSVGFGTANPRVAEKSGTAYHANRRVEFKITREQKEVMHSDSAPESPTEVTPPAGTEQGEK